MTANSKQSTMSLILVPSIITLAITILRTVGELQHWSPRFFSTEPGGGGAIVGISWLPVIFGIYFAWKLAGSGELTTSPLKALGLDILGFVIVAGAGFAATAIAGKDALPVILLVVLAAMTIAAFIQFAGWSQLTKTLLAYGIAARVPVIIVYFLAFQGNWHTHYDAIPPNAPQLAELSVIRKFINLALLPQLFLWIPFTILVGTFFGSITGLIANLTGKSKR